MSASESSLKPVLVGVGAVAVILLIAVLAVRHAATRPRETADIIGIGQLAAIDPALLIAEPAGTVITGIAEAAGIALDFDGNLYAAGARECAVFDPQGSELRRFSLTVRARCIAVGGDGTVFVGAGDHVDLYGADGRHTAAWPAPAANTFITSIAADDAQVWIADAGNRTAGRYDREGTLLGRISGPGDGDGPQGFVIPSPHFDLAIEDDDAVWIVNPGRHTVQNYSADGRLRTGWGLYGSGIERFCGCCNPADIALMPDGAFVTSEKGLVRVKLYGPDGSFRGVIAGPEVFSPGAEGLDLAVDARSRIHVLDPGTGIVHRFEVQP